MAKAKTLQVKLVKSPIGTPKIMRANLKGLGLGSLNTVRELPDNPSVQGMIAKVHHLVTVL